MMRHRQNRSSRAKTHDCVGNSRDLRCQSLLRAGSGAAPPSAAAAEIAVEVRHEVGLGGIETRRLVEVERGLGVEGEGATRQMTPDPGPTSARFSVIQPARSPPAPTWTESRRRNHGHPSRMARPHDRHRRRAHAPTPPLRALQQQPMQTRVEKAFPKTSVMRARDDSNKMRRFHEIPTAAVRG